MKPIIVIVLSVLIPLGYAPTGAPNQGTSSSPTIPERPIGPDPDESRRIGEERSDNGLGMPFRYCPAGTFLMGDPGRQSPGRGPVRVTISQGVWMGRHEVTQGQWREVMGHTLREQRAQDPSQPRPVGDGTMRDHVGEGSDYPIYYVSHDEAESFCRAMTEAEREAGRLPEG